MWRKVYNFRAEALQRFRRQGEGEIAKEPKRFKVIDLWETHIDISSNSGEHAQKVSVQELKLLNLEDPK
jgi:hypothetical protein